MSLQSLPLYSSQNTWSFFLVPFCSYICAYKIRTLHLGKDKTSKWWETTLFLFPRYAYGFSSIIFQLIYVYSTYFYVSLSSMLMLHLNTIHIFTEAGVGLTLKTLFSYILWVLNLSLFPIPIISVYQFSYLIYLLIFQSQMNWQNKCK